MKWLRRIRQEGSGYAAIFAGSSEEISLRRHKKAISLTIISITPPTASLSATAVVCFVAVFLKQSKIMSMSTTPCILIRICRCTELEA